MTNLEFEAIRDEWKHVDGNIVWTEDEDHSPSVEFRANIRSETTTGLTVRGSLNLAIGKLSYLLLHRGTGRIYALDVGVDHHNPNCHNIGEVHKHSWSEALRDKEAYVPDDITATVEDPIELWQQFCAEAHIVHNGTLMAPPRHVLEFPF